MSTASERASHWFLLILLYIRYWAWEFVTIGGLGLLYIHLMAEGLRYLVPALGVKMSKLPFLGFLDDYDVTHRLLWAHLAAIGFLLAVRISWLWVLSYWLHGPAFLEQFKFKNVDSFARVVNVLAAVILTVDLYIFYVSIVQSAWGGSTFSVSALLVTAGYGVVLVIVSLISIMLRVTRW